MTATADPRRTLPTPKIERTQPIAAAQYLDFTRMPGTSTDAGRAWVGRGQNAVVLHVAARTTGVVVEELFASETVLIAVDDASGARITWQGQSVAVDERAVAVIPPGDVRIDNTGTADLVLLVRADEPGWAERAANADAYAESDPRVDPAHPWPEPVGGARVRVYRHSDHPPQDGIFGCIIRSRSFMVNLLPAHDGPRPADRLSPHFHEEFEQYSLATDGEYVHHIRTPWVTDRNQWKDDEHVHVASPSLTIIPPPTVHTSEASSQGLNRLIDIFSPPRVDFSAKPGWVRNADDYPIA